MRAAVLLLAASLLGCSAETSRLPRAESLEEASSPPAARMVVVTRRIDAPTVDVTAVCPIGTFAVQVGCFATVRFIDLHYAGNVAAESADSATCRFHDYDGLGGWTALWCAP